MVATQSCQLSLPCDHENWGLSCAGVEVQLQSTLCVGDLQLLLLLVAHIEIDTLFFPPLVPTFSMFCLLAELLWFCAKCHEFEGTYGSAKASALHDVQHILVKDFMYALKVGACYHPCSTTHQLIKWYIWRMALLIFVVLHLVLPPRNWPMPSSRHVCLRMDVITMLQNLQMSKAQFK